MSGVEGHWLRSSAARALLLAALVMSLVLAMTFVAIDASKRADVGTLADTAPMTDEQARNQVLNSAKQIVDAAQLQDVSGSYIFLSCTSLHDPPYQAAVYLNFGVPPANSVRRIREVAAAMMARGWQKAPSMAEHFGMKLTKDGVTTTFHENPDDARFGAMRLYGECRNTTDHRNDNPAFTDITDQLR